MNKGISLMVFICLLAASAYAQMGGGMGGMMGPRGMGGKSGLYEPVSGAARI